MIKRILLFILVGIVFVALAIQLVPYGRDHQNPPVIQNASWGSPEAEQVARLACYDCHSNETVWPWYSNIAPFSWLVQRDVEEGRQYVNFSEWGQGDMELDEIGEVIAEGEMPPLSYLPTHPEARLSVAQRQTLLDGLPGSTSARSGEGDDD